MPRYTIIVDRGQDYVITLEYLSLTRNNVMWAWVDREKRQAYFSIDNLQEEEITYLSLKVQSFKCKKNNA